MLNELMKKQKIPIPANDNINHIIKKERMVKVKDINIIKCISFNSLLMGEIQGYEDKELNFTLFT